MKVLSYYSLSLFGLLFVCRYLKRAYLTSWYDVSKAGFFGNLSWDPDVKNLMAKDPLEHKSCLRTHAWHQAFRDILVSCFVLGLWMGRDGLIKFIQNDLNKDKMPGSLFLLGFGTLAATLVGIFYQWRIKARSENRQNWIKDIREVFGFLITNLPVPNDSYATREKKRLKYLSHHARLELLLNPSEKVHRALMALLRHAYDFQNVPIDKIPREKLALAEVDPQDGDNFKELKSGIIRLANVALKREWEQVKHAR